MGDHPSAEPKSSMKAWKEYIYKIGNQNDTTVTDALYELTWVGRQFVRGFEHREELARRVSDLERRLAAIESAR